MKLFDGKLNHREFVRRFLPKYFLEVAGCLEEHRARNLWKKLPRPCLGQDCLICEEIEAVVVVGKNRTFVKNNLWRLAKVISQVGEYTALRQEYRKAKSA